LHVPALGTLFFTIIGLMIVYTNKNNSNMRYINDYNYYTIAIKPYIAELYYFKGMEDSIYKKDYEKSLVDFK